LTPQHGTFAAGACRREVHRGTDGDAQQVDTCCPPGKSSGIPGSFQRRDWLEELADARRRQRAFPASSYDPVAC